MTQKNESEKGALRSDQSSLMFGEGFSFSGYERDPVYLNLRGKKFLDVAGCSGLDSISDGRAAVFADFDNDGDLDVFMTTIQGPAHLLFRNNVGSANAFLRVSVEGKTGHSRDAFGAVVRAHTSAGILTKLKTGGSGFISGHDPRLLFGLGPDRTVDSLEVTWPGGVVETFAGPFAAGSSLLLREGRGRAEIRTLSSASLPDPLTRAQRLARSLHVRVGEPLPDFAVKTLDGRTVALRDALPRGRRALVNLWATWCVPCRREMPELQALRPALRARGIDVIGLNVDVDPADVAGFARARGVDYPVLLAGEAGVARLYATDEVEVPLTFLLDESGAVQDILSGWSDLSRRRLSELAGKR